MPSYIIKLEHNGESRYLEWSTIVDAPVTYGMPLEEFKVSYIQRYRHSTLQALEERLKRVEQTGISAIDYGSIEELIAVNRAGPNETELTLEEIIRDYFYEPRKGLPD